MSNQTDKEKLKKAKEKLACHIEPPKVKPAEAGAPGLSASEKIRLTEMTSAGG